jgi:type IV secretory pathway TrbF-like protein
MYACRNCAVLADPIAQQDLVRRAYAFVDQGTAQFLQAYMTDPARDPRVIGRELTRVVEVTSILPVPGATDSRTRRGTAVAPVTWKVAWTETDYPRGGGTPTATAWEAYVTTRRVPPTTPERVEANPLGLFVTAVSWTQVSARQPVGDMPGRVVGGAVAAPITPPAVRSPPLIVDPESRSRQESEPVRATVTPTGGIP